MAKNKLYNQSYFVKRLVESGFDVKRLNIKFEDDDYRRWIILVNSRDTSYKYNICITCFKYIENDEKKFSFKFQGQKNRDFILDTLSMSTIIKILRSTFKEEETE